MLDVRVDPTVRLVARDQRGDFLIFIACLESQPRAGSAFMRAIREVTRRLDPEYIACDVGRGRSTTAMCRTGSSRACAGRSRRTQDCARNRLHLHDERGDLRGFVFPYLDQRASQLPVIPPDLPRRHERHRLPDFAAMDKATIELLAGRGENLTLLLVDYCPEL